MSEEKSQFSVLVNNASAERGARRKTVPAPAPAAEPAWELPDLPEPAESRVEKTAMLGAQVPATLKLAFEGRVLEARRYYPDLEMREVLSGLAELFVEDDRVFRLLLGKVGE